MELLIIAVVLLGTDRLREEVLIGLGWKIHRIWAPSWVSRRSIEIERLRTAIENEKSSLLHLTEYRKHQVDEIPTHQPEPDSSDYESFEGHNAIGQPYTCYDLKASLDETIRANKQSRFKRRIYL